METIKTITITSKKIEIIKTMIKDFLIQKARLDNKIRTYEVNESDIYKEILLEEYLAGMLIMLKTFEIKYTIDDKQLGIDIEFNALEQEIDNPQAKVMESFIFLKIRLENLLETIEDKRTNEELEIYEKELHKNFYAYLGAITITNKLGIKFYLTNLNKKDLNNYPILQQIYKNDEVEDYIEMNKKINELTDLMYNKFNYQKSYDIINWRNLINSKYKKINDKLIKESNNSKNFDENNEIKVYQNELNEIDEEKKIKLANIQEKIIMLENEHQKLLLQFATEFFDYHKPTLLDIM